LLIEERVEALGLVVLAVLGLETPMAPLG